MNSLRIAPITCIILFALGCQNVEAQNIYKEDFLEFWEDYNSYYGYFGESGIDWNKAKEIYLPAADTIKNNYEFTCLLEQVVNEFHNGHVSLNTNYTTSNRIIPSGADVYAEKSGNAYFITDVRLNSKAEKCGIKSGMEVEQFNNKPINTQLEQFLPKSTTAYTPAMYGYAINMLFAGTYDKKREFTVKENGALKTYNPDDIEIKNSEDLLEYKILDGNIGYIKINNSLGNNSLIPDFDKALDDLIQTKGIILDLTETPGGGNTTVARAIMGRFIDKELPYQKHVINEKEYGTVRSWIEYVVPRKTTYKKNVVVMVGHWTGSMGEGIAIGFDAMKRAKITGTKMAGLIGAIYTFNLKNTKIGFQIPYEKMYHVNGTPREDYLPPYLTKNSAETFIKALNLIK